MAVSGVRARHGSGNGRRHAVLVVEEDQADRRGADDEAEEDDGVVALDGAERLGLELVGVREREGQRLSRGEVDVRAAAEREDHCGVWDWGWVSGWAMEKWN